MINLFVNSTTFGQAMGATFNLAQEGTLSEKRLTPLENCEVLAPAYEKMPNAMEIADLISRGDNEKVTKISKAISAENIRVNSLVVLMRELQFVHETFGLEIPGGVITAYVPAELLKELHQGRVKYYLDENAETKYYSEFERAIWRQVMPLLQFYFCNIVFKNIASCKVNERQDPIQQHRANIHASIYSKMLTAYREMKALRRCNSDQQTPQYATESAF